MRRSVTIAGGGLAGLSLGVGLRKQGVPVQLHEAGSYPRHRVCGEFICGVTEETLKTLGIQDCLQDAVTCQSTAWYFRGRPIYQKRLPRPALGISRYRLDERLVSMYRELGGELIEQSRVRPEGLTEEGVVSATGRKAEGNTWLGLKCHLKGLRLSQDLELHLGQGAYLGLSKIEDDTVNACGLFRRRPELTVGKHDVLFAYLEACGLGYVLERFAEADVVEGSHCAVSALGYGPKAYASEDSFAIGDFAGPIPPFTGNGMSIAFESAALSLSGLLAWHSGEVTWEKARSQAMTLQYKKFAGRRRVARLLHPMITGAQGQMALSVFARSRLLPFTPLFNLTH